MMKKHSFKILLVSIATFFFCGALTAIAGDLDDGISSYTDDSVAKYDDLGKGDQNISYIITKAKADAAVRSKKGDETANNAQGGSAGGIGAMNSVVLGAGSKITGDVIIIDQSRGDQTQVVK